MSEFCLPAIPKIGFRESTHKDTKPKKSTHKDTPKKHPQGQNEKAPTHYIQRVEVCLSLNQLSQLLEESLQTEWNTRCRINGLILLLAHITKQNKKTGFAISSALARDYCSPIKRRKLNTTESSPLPLLIKIGVLEVVSGALWRGHLKQSTIYRLNNKYTGQKISVELDLSPKQSQRFENAQARKEKRINQRFPIRAGILDSLNNLSFAKSARPIVAKLGKQGTNEIVGAIDCREHKCTFDGTGQATTTISSLPRELKPHLKLSGKTAIFCDISNAHHCWLPRILDDRMTYYRKTQMEVWSICFFQSIDALNQNQGAWIFRLFIAQRPPVLALDCYEMEKAELINFLNSGDYYLKWCEEGEVSDKREKIKKIANQLLNFESQLARRIPLYRKWKSKFPLVFRILEDIKSSKSRAHRGISIQLRYFTAQAVNAALKELQAMGIDAIPQTDAILCQRQHR